ncbi:MAG: dihydroneopterin aldolase, partial [Clostridia bacterium]
MLGQKFVFSAVLYLDTAKAGVSDELEDSVNYGEVCHFIREFAEGRTFKLLESLAEHTAAAVLDRFPLVKRIDLEIEKPWAPIGLPLESVSVEISRGWHQAFIALGSNMGDKKKYLDDAVKAMDDLDGCRIVTVADYIETEPYGGVEQDD